MIALPSDWMSMVRVGTTSNSLYLALINDAGEYYIYYQPLDPAIPLPNVIDQLTTRLTPERMAAERARRLFRDLHEELGEPTDQNWRPLPLVAHDIVSLDAYKALKGMPGKTESDAPKPPSNLPKLPEVE